MRRCPTTISSPFVPAATLHALPHSRLASAHFSQISNRSSTRSPSLFARVLAVFALRHLARFMNINMRVRSGTMSSVLTEAFFGQKHQHFPNLWVISCHHPKLSVLCSAQINDRSTVRMASQSTSSPNSLVPGVRNGGVKASLELIGSPIWSGSRIDLCPQRATDIRLYTFGTPQFAR